MTFAKQLQLHQKRVGYTDALMCAALDVGDSTYRAWRNADPKRTPLKVTQDGVLARLEKLHPPALVRLDPDNDQIRAIPNDDYAPVWNYVPERQSADDSIAMGHWVWRKVFLGYVGQVTGVMLGPEWADVLTATP